MIRELFVVGSLVSLPWFLAAACSDRVETPTAEPSHAALPPPASAPVSPATPAQTAASVLGAGATPTSPAKAAARAATAAAGGAGGLAANGVPVPMPGGGVRLDMRNNTTNVRVLEKQADGTFKETCTDVPSINKPSSQQPASQPRTSP